MIITGTAVEMLALFRGLDFAQLKTTQEKIMATLEEIKSELADVKANLTETNADIAQILAINTTQSASIADLEAKLAAMQAGVITQEQLDEVGALVADIKAQSRAVADVVPPPTQPAA